MVLVRDSPGTGPADLPVVVVAADEAADAGILPEEVPGMRRRGAIEKPVAEIADLHYGHLPALHAPGERVERRKHPVDVAHEEHFPDAGEIDHPYLSGLRPDLVESGWKIESWHKKQKVGSIPEEGEMTL